MSPPRRSRAPPISLFWDAGTCGLQKAPGYTDGLPSAQRDEDDTALTVYSESCLTENRSSSCVHRIRPVDAIHSPYRDVIHTSPWKSCNQILHRNVVGREHLFSLFSSVWENNSTFPK